MAPWGGVVSEQARQAGTSIAELGRPVAYLALREGIPVYGRAGERIGVVDHVVADEPTDIFEGLIVHTLPLPGRHLFADADQIAEMRERGVLLAVDGDDLHDLSHKPSRHVNRGDSVESPLEARLRRAWDWITGQL